MVRVDALMNHHCSFSNAAEIWQLAKLNFTDDLQNMPGSCQREHQRKYDARRRSELWAVDQHIVGCSAFCLSPGFVEEIATQ